MCFSFNKKKITRKKTSTLFSFNSVEQEFDVRNETLYNFKNFWLQKFIQNQLPFPRSNFTFLFSDFYRSNRAQMLFKIGVFRNFAKFTGKRLCWSLFLIKLQVRRGLLLVKWQASVCNFAKSNMSFKTSALLKRDSSTSVLLWILWNF